MLRTIWRFSCREVRSKLYSDKWLGRRRAKKKLDDNYHTQRIMQRPSETCAALFFFILLLRRDILSFEVALYVAIPTD